MADEEDLLGDVTAAEMWRRVLDAQRRTIRTSTPGKVQTYRLTGDHRGTADVELPIRPDGEEQTVLSHVPVLVLGGGDGYLLFPHESGDTGLVAFCDTEIGAWRASGDSGAPADDGRLNASGPVLIPGLRTMANRVPSVPAGATVLKAGRLNLGDHLATKAAVHEDVLSGVDSVLSALDTWGALVQTATGVPWAGPQAAIVAVRAAIAAGGYQSPTVFVED